MKKVFLFSILIVPLASQALVADFNGYFRAGVGINSLGGDQACVGNSGASAFNEFRWGNECDMYGESTFNFSEDAKSPDWKLVTTFSYGNKNREDFEQGS